MADEEEGAEKPFEATPRKLLEARKRGEVPISQDLITVGVYFGLLVCGLMTGVWSIQVMGTALLPLLNTPDILAPIVFDEGGRHRIAAIGLSCLLGASVWLGLPYLFALITTFLQGALIFAPTKLRPKLSRISPISNAKQKYGSDGLFNFLKSFVKLGIYCVVLGFVFNSRLNEILAMPGLSVQDNLTLATELCFRFLVAATIAILAISVIDFFWQRAQFLRRQRMSLKEMKDETKETEGDPYTKQARRQRGYDIATNQMLSDVPSADVVVVNPEHYAVALRWDRGKGTAPVCVAKGVDEIAARIREKAVEFGVPIYRDPPTARALFAEIELGEEIPVDYYKAIASAIRFADAMRDKARSRAR